MASTTTVLKSISSLQEELDIQTLQLMDFAPSEIMDIVVDKIKELAATEIVENAPKKGDKRIPRFALEDSISGNVVRSKDILSSGPMVLTFFRGEWCDYCGIQLRALEQVAPEIRAKGATLVAISPQSQQHSKNMAQKSGLSSFAIVSDYYSQVARQFNIAYELDPTLKDLYDGWGIHLNEYNADGSFILPLAATFVIDQDGRILYSFVDTDPGKRAEPADVLNAIPEPIAATTVKQAPTEKPMRLFKVQSRGRKIVMRSGFTGRRLGRIAH